MKNMKKILALLVAVLMIVASMSALAAEGDLNIVITPQTARTVVTGQTFSAYKLFDGVYGTGDEVAYTIDPTTNAFYLDATAKAVLENYFTFTQSPTDEHVMYVEPIASSGVASDTRALADALAGKIPAGATAYTAQGTADGATINVKDGGKGFYLVTGSVIPANTARDGEDPVTTAIALLNVKGETQSIAAKADAPTLTKEITAVKEGQTAIPADLLDEAGKAAVAKVGATVEYKLTSVVPNMVGYTSYEMKFQDTMDAGLTFDENVSVKIGSTENITVTSYYAKVGNGFTLTFDKTFLNNYSAGDTIEITYSATVNGNSIEYDFEKNTANLTYSNNPYDDTSKETTPDQETYVINIKIDVLKYGADESDVLSGAQFKLYKMDGENKVYYKLDATNGVTWVAKNSSDTFTTTESGAFDVQIKGLDQGTYYLEETKAPEGYNLLGDAIAVTITATESEEGGKKKVTYTSSTGAEITNGVINLEGTHTENMSALATEKVQNQKGTQLPSTGGMGTTILYVGGSILVILAAILLITKRHMSAED